METQSSRIASVFLLYFADTIAYYSPQVPPLTGPGVSGISILQQHDDRCSVPGVDSQINLMTNEGE
jgi:hypothetical protein